MFISSLEQLVNIVIWLHFVKVRLEHMVKLLVYTSKGSLCQQRGRDVVLQYYRSMATALQDQDKRSCDSLAGEHIPMNGGW
jgi:TfoX/Sxy family transcriptional regulator of competence genes